MHLESSEENKVSEWNFIFVFLFFGVVFFFLSNSIINLQMRDSQKYSKLSDNNQVRLEYSYPNRGVIFDRNGEKIAENIAATDVYLNLKAYRNDKGEISDQEIREVANLLEEILKDTWHSSSILDKEYSSLSEYILSTASSYKIQGLDLSRIKIASDIDNDKTIKLKSYLGDLNNIEIVEGNKRSYPLGKPFSHILGYTTIVYQEDLEKLDYLGYDNFVALNGYNDVVGRSGVEKVYDEELIGKKGVYAVETDAYGTPVSENKRVISEVQSGRNLELSIDSKAQLKMYEILSNAVDQYDATGAVGIVEDVHTGELITLVSYPSYDNNEFIGGISHAKYEKLQNNRRIPLLDRTISAQFPPGSTFKTIAAVGALDSGAINLNTYYISKRGYTFSNGADFQEYHNKAYGRLNVIGGITVSSNIFFCEVIRNWDIDELVKYYESFGIGQKTGVDLYGELAGRLPSPENKIALAKNPNITWLDPLWYPEGDGCNTVIGQGITLVTPLQMANWVSTIANGGKVKTPHLAMKISGSSSEQDMVFEDKRRNIVSDLSLKIVRQGMREAVSSSRGGIYAFRGSELNVAAKTGTAEFGRLNEDGVYEHRHGWVTGFFPYEEPRYAFVLLLEDGGESYYAAETMREFLDWWEDNMETVSN